MTNDVQENKERFKTWLNETLESGQKRGDRIAWLVKTNGGWHVDGWGFISYSEGPWQSGLEQDDAIELLQWRSYFGGVDEFSGFCPHDVFLPMFNEFVATIEREYHEGRGDV